MLNIAEFQIKRNNVPAQKPAKYEFFLLVPILEHFLTVRTQGLVSRQRPEVRRYMPYRIQQKSSRSSELLNKLCRMKGLLDNCIGFAAEPVHNFVLELLL